MRFLASFCLFLPFVAACGADLGEPQPTTVRERLERDVTELAIAPDASAGAVTASRKTSQGWVPGLADLKISAGSIALSADAEGTVTLEDAGLDIAPIEIPDTVLGYAVRFEDIHIGLVEPMKVVVGWSGDDEARGETIIELSLAWSLTNHGTTSPLGSPDLPPVPAELRLSGTGTDVHAELRVHAPGQLWSWANLLELGDLSLIVAADSQ